MLSCWIGERFPTRTRAPIGTALAIFSLCVIVFTSTSLYLNLSYMNWFWMPFSPAVTSGRDLMINSGIFHFESVNTAGLIDALAAIQVLLYPLWTYLGLRLWHQLKKKQPASSS
ncbi:MAG: hypothetical protein HXY34_06800 [Candidatus Thorarchaeota archaeon]|nr:hypothetical protein [Candidatus Thorarchaeota archaeon]